MTTTEDEPVKLALEMHPEIRLAILFGSVASGRAGATSDLGVALDHARVQ